MCFVIVEGVQFYGATDMNNVVESSPTIFVAENPSGEHTTSILPNWTLLVHHCLYNLNFAKMTGHKTLTTLINIKV